MSLKLSIIGIVSIVILCGVMQISAERTFTLEVDDQVIVKLDARDRKVGIKNEGELVGAGTIVSIGKLAWGLVSNGQEINSNTSWTGAVPSEMTDWRNMTGWRANLSPTYKMKWTNHLWTLSE